MLEWPEVQLDVGYDKRLMYEYRIEPLNCAETRMPSRGGTQPPIIYYHRAAVSAVNAALLCCRSSYICIRVLLSDCNSLAI